MQFNITVKNRVAEVLSEDGRLPLLVCGNMDVKVVFSFDEEWDPYPIKTARFVYREHDGQGRLVYTDLAFRGNTVVIPIMQNISELWVGVLAGGCLTSSAARIGCLSSITDFAVEDSGAVSVMVGLSLEYGKQIVTTGNGKPMSAVTIVKPDTLIPENIRKGVNIAGIIGTYEGTVVEALTAPTLALEGTVLVITPAEGVAETYTIQWSEDGNGYANVLTVEATGNVMRIDCSEYIQSGKNYFIVTATNTTTAESVTTLKSVCYQELSGLTAPTISLDGTILDITFGEGEFDRYEILHSTDGNGFMIDGIVNVGTTDTALSVINPYLEVGDNWFKVRVVNEETGEMASSNQVYYELAALTAPTISLDGTILTITPGEGIASRYDIEYSEDGNGYYNATSVGANGETVTVDLSDYLYYDKTYFIVAAVNEWTGESVYHLQPVIYIKPASDTYTLTVNDAGGSLDFYYVINKSYTYIRSGEPDGTVESGGVITGLLSTDTVVLAPTMNGGYAMDGGTSENCTLTGSTSYVMLSEFTADATVTLTVNY